MYSSRSLVNASSFSFAGSILANSGMLRRTSTSLVRLMVGPPAGCLVHRGRAVAAGPTGTDGRRGARGMLPGRSAGLLLFQLLEPGARLGQRLRGVVQARGDLAHDLDADQRKLGDQVEEAVLGHAQRLEVGVRDHGGG